MVRRTRLPVDCASLERQKVVGREVYKHLAPLEPEHRFARALPLRQAWPTPRQTLLPKRKRGNILRALTCPPYK